MKNKIKKFVRFLRKQGYQYIIVKALACAITREGEPKGIGTYYHVGEVRWRNPGRRLVIFNNLRKDSDETVQTDRLR